ncbi:MAG: DUF6449 domain-containing protein, partial [Lachnospiraceae bacterium]|nr:DUF6449 domain-containing protein [Lachnospiraceae bacterium]
IFESGLFEILGMLVFGSRVCVIIEFIYRVDIHQTLSHKWHFAVTAVLACVIFFFFRFDLTGFNTYIPEKEELEAMSVSIDGSSYVTYSEDEEITYSCSVFDRLDALEMEDFDSLYEIAQNGVSNAAEYTSFDSAYDEICVVYMKYHLKNGKEVYRSYEVDGDLFYEIMDELMQDESVRELYFPICAWEEEDISEIRGSYCWFYGYGENDLFGTDKENSEDDSEGGYYGSIDIEVFDENLPDLIEAYRKDLETISYKEIYYANGEIDFYFGEEFININYPLSTAFTNTMELLEEIYYSS